MIVVAFFLVLMLTVFITNKKTGAGANDDTLDFGRNDSLIIFLCMVSSFGVEYLAKTYFKEYYTIILIASAFTYLMILIIMNIHRENLIQKNHEEIANVYRALQDIFGSVNSEEIDFVNVPFVLEKNSKTGEINKITIDTSIHGNKINDNTVINSQYSLNKYFPELQWISDLNFPNRELTFKGLPKPPSIAMYPGGDYRPTTLIPLGLGGEGEICWNLSDSKWVGTSSYIGEDGNPVDLIKTPSAPQCLTLGSTGGGKSIFIGQKIDLLENI